MRSLALLLIGAAGPPLALKRSAKPPGKNLAFLLFWRATTFFWALGCGAPSEHILLSCFSGSDVRRPFFGCGAPGEHLAFLLFLGATTFQLSFRGLLSNACFSCFPGPLASKD